MDSGNRIKFLSRICRLLPSTLCQRHRQFLSEPTFHLIWRRRAKPKSLTCKTIPSHFNLQLNSMWWHKMLCASTQTNKIIISESYLGDVQCVYRTSSSFSFLLGAVRTFSLWPDANWVAPHVERNGWPANWNWSRRKNKANRANDRFHRLFLWMSNACATWRACVSA